MPFKVCLFRLVSDLILIYPLYAVMFADQGLSTGEISTLLLVWSVVAFSLEVPTGGLADRFSRRHLLAVAQLIRAAGFVVWWLYPSFTGYLVGFVLWGIESVLTSGAFEALVYDELTAEGNEHTYARLMGRAESIGLAAQVIVGFGAAALVELGFAPVLWASAFACVATAGVVLSFPNAAPTVPASERFYLQYLREGLREAARNPVVRRLVLFSGALFGLGAIDEFYGLILTDAGVGDSWVGIWYALFFVAAAAGSLFAYRASNASRARMALITCAWGLSLLVTSLVGGIAVPLGLLAFNTMMYIQRIVLDAQLQSSITSNARATVTSAQGLVAELFALLTFVSYGVVSGVWSEQVATGVIAVAILVVAAVYGGSAWLAGDSRSDRPT